jgi:hypothetical protein
MKAIYIGSIEQVYYMGSKSTCLLLVDTLYIVIKNSSVTRRQDIGSIRPRLLQECTLYGVNNRLSQEDTLHGVNNASPVT